MAIHLITDFGLEGPYVGQVLARLNRDAPSVPAFSLFADAPAFDARHSAYLVAAYGRDTAEGDVLLCVVDPGVGTLRAGLALSADGRWYVGPDNGLLEVAAAHAGSVQWWQLEEPTAGFPRTFHGRDWFAPAAARIACAQAVPGRTCHGPPRGGEDWPADLEEIVYVDHYGNAMTGLREQAVPPSARLRVGGVAVGRGTVFADAPKSTPFWYPNANGLVEIAVNRGSASEVLALDVGLSVGVEV